MTKIKNMPVTYQDSINLLNDLANFIIPSEENEFKEVTVDELFSRITFGIVSSQISNHDYYRETLNELEIK